MRAIAFAILALAVSNDAKGEVGAYQAIGLAVAWALSIAALVCAIMGW